MSPILPGEDTEARRGPLASPNPEWVSGAERFGARFATGQAQAGDHGDSAAEQRLPTTSEF